MNCKPDIPLQNGVPIAGAFPITIFAGSPEAPTLTVPVGKISTISLFASIYKS